MHRIALLLLVIATLNVPLYAQADFTGVWGVNRHEDNESRDPHPGEYAGVPLNEAGKQRANTWSASIQKLQVWQCRPHPIYYWPRAPQTLMIRQEVNPTTREVVAYYAQIGESVEAVIYMDGRPHPSKNSLHSWNGFSTGEWMGDILKITTTHLKDSYLRRNGVNLSDQATLTQYWMRQGDIMTWVQIHYDPVYLAEPYVRITEYRARPGAATMTVEPCIVADELAAERGYVPHWLPGQNPTLDVYAEQFESPLEANQGGPQTMYPEYRERLEQLGGVRVPKQRFNRQ